MAKKKTPKESPQRRLFIAVPKEDGIGRVLDEIEENVPGVQDTEQATVDDCDDFGGLGDDELVVYEITIKAVAHYGNPQRQRTQL